MKQDPVCGMEVDPNSALKIVIGSQTYFFCSTHCMNTFARSHHINISPACIQSESSPFYRNKIFVVSIVLAGLIVLSYFVSLLVPFRIALFEYINKIWWAVALGIVLGGFIDYFIPREYVSHILSRPHKKTILYSVVFGFFASTCSHGILALAIQLHKKGASNASVVAFLLASPWANLPLTIMLLGFFGLRALFIIASAIVIAGITGLIFQVLEAKGMIEQNPNTVTVGNDFSIWRDVSRRLGSYRFSFLRFVPAARGICRGSCALSGMVLWWILIGIGLASAAGAYIPTHIFTTYMGPTALGLAVTLSVATIMEVCSEGTAPMAFELFRQTGALGNSFVFLMAGVVTDYTEIGLLWHNVGKKTALWLPLITVPQVIILGFVANIFL